MKAPGMVLLRQSQLFHESLCYEHPWDLSFLVSLSLSSQPSAPLAHAVSDFELSLSSAKIHKNTLPKKR